MENKALKIIEELNDEQVITLLETVQSKAPRAKKTELDSYKVLEQISDKSKTEFVRLILFCIVSEPTEIGTELTNELIENKEFLEMQRANSDSKRGVELWDIVGAAAILLPLIQTQISYKKNSKGKYELKISYGKDFVKIFEIASKTFIELIKELKNIKFKFKNFDFDKD